MRKYLSVFLSLTMLFVFLVTPASAGGLIGNMETDIPIVGLTDLGVRTLVSRYFTQRKAYLQGKIDAMNSAVVTMVVDEATHRETLSEAGAIFVDSTVQINLVIVEDFMARVEATENITFMIGNERIQESVVHLLYICAKDDGTIIVCSDGYTEMTTGFSSASYVNTGGLDLENISLQGSPNCIIEVAYREIGTTYLEGAATKYGSWYGDYIGDPGFATSAWCAMFVVWCAYHANIPNYVVPYLASCPRMAETFIDDGEYYRSASSGGSYVPEPGDIVFMGYYNEAYDTPGHVGIVAFVSNGTVFIVDGNITKNVNGTKMRTVRLGQESLTSTYILAYGKPAYMNNSHTIDYWSYDDYMHSGICVVCDGQVSEYHDLIEMDGGIGCYTCGYQSDMWCK